MKAKSGRKSTRGRASDSPAPRFEGLFVHPGLAAADGEKARRAITAIAARHGLAKWRGRPVGPGAEDWILEPPKGVRVSVPRAWDLVARLREDRDVAAVDPAFITPGHEFPPAEAAPASRRRAARSGLFGGGEPLPESDDFEWSIKLCKVPKAWAFSQAQGKTPFGRGIRVGHPDTGYTEHSDFFDPTRVLVAEGFDFFEGDADPSDPLGGQAPSHGTSTGSVIMSAVGPAGVAHVTGSAPEALLVPYRVSDSVIHFSYRALCESLYRAVAAGCHVVSMSLGGPFSSKTLLRALKHCTDNGLILFAASGNHYPWVVYPARYTETIAVCACNARKEIWDGATAGDDVDVTAPGESVWRARMKSNGEEVARGDGTSYATATMAGVCALWLAHHGRDALLQRFTPAGLAGAFKDLLMTSGVHTPAGWDQSRHGAGIADALALLNAPLPSTAPAIGTNFRATGRPPEENDFDRIASYFPDADPGRVRQALQRLLGVDERGLKDALVRHASEIEFHIATDGATRDYLQAQMAPRARAARSRARGASRPFGRGSRTLKAALAAG